MNVKMIFVLFSAGMALFLYNRAAPAGTVKSTHGVLTPAGAESQADAAGAATAIPLPDMSQPYNYNAGSDSTYHSDLGSGFSPDGSSFARSSSVSGTPTTAIYSSPQYQAFQQASAPGPVAVYSSPQYQAFTQARAPSNVYIPPPSSGGRTAL